MRTYVQGFYGIFLEESVSLGIRTERRVWRKEEEEFWSVIDELRQDIVNAGGDWTGTLTLSGEFYWDWKDPDGIQDLLKTWFHGTSQASNAFDNLMTERLTDKSPRGREKRKFRLVPLGTRLQRKKKPR